jgi:ketosteroid isomerase-like protein
VRSRLLLLPAACCLACLCSFAQLSSGIDSLRLHAQLALDPLAGQTPAANPLSDPSVSPGSAFLFDLEAKFAHATATGGGKAFASFFADDAVTLANGKPPVIGRSAIAEQATWLPSQYQLTWTPDGGRMSEAGDMGFTWGHYEGDAKDQNGSPIVTSGRYFTVWKRQPDGSWKVALDASNTEPANSGDCCRLP